MRASGRTDIGMWLEERALRPQQMREEQLQARTGKGGKRRWRCAETEEQPSFRGAELAMIMDGGCFRFVLEHCKAPDGHKELMRSGSPILARQRPPIHQGVHTGVVYGASPGGRGPDLVLGHLFLRLERVETLQIVCPVVPRDYDSATLLSGVYGRFMCSYSSGTLTKFPPQFVSTIPNGPWELRTGLRGRPKRARGVAGADCIVGSWDGAGWMVWVKMYLGEMQGRTKNHPTRFNNTSFLRPGPPYTNHAYEKFFRDKSQLRRTNHMFALPPCARKHRASRAGGYPLQLDETVLLFPLSTLLSSRTCDVGEIRELVSHARLFVYGAKYLQRWRVDRMTSARMTCLACTWAL
ncbi:hypothetical protein BD779DRAFT_1790786 [Infundibulicybe gibba]|nr:hypothetical protein BD779DRAFT_1790786 [Infundibulicybe gibba]